MKEKVDNNKLTPPDDTMSDCPSLVGDHYRSSVVIVPATTLNIQQTSPARTPSTDSIALHAP